MALFTRKKKEEPKAATPSAPPVNVPDVEAPKVAASEAAAPTPSVRMESDAALPIFYTGQGQIDLLDRANRVDQEYRYRWIQMSAKNQQIKRMKGWEPVESPDIIQSLGFEQVLVNRAGRVQWGDVELWRMPRARAEAIRKHINQKTTRRTSSVRHALDAMSREVAGQSGNRVAPFVGTGGEDIFTPTPYKGD
jgi:hypothetical protein